MPPLIPFSTINNISISIKRSNFTLVIFKAACHADLGAERKCIEDTYFKSSKIHRLTKMYCFEHTNHDTILSFLFKKLYKIFLPARNLHLQYLPFLSDCKNLPFQVMMFH